MRTDRTRKNLTGGIGKNLMAGQKRITTADRVRKRKEQERMTINIEYETDKELKLDYEDIINRVINEAVDYAKCPYEAEVNVTLTDNDEIKKIKKFMLQNMFPQKG